MGATYKSGQVARPEQSVFIATPAYQLVKPGYAHSLALTTAELTRLGIPFELNIQHDNCHVDDGRNSLVSDFLYETQCTDLVWIDADLRWRASEFTRLLKHQSHDIIAGAYPLKSFPYKYPVGKLLHNESETETRAGLLSVSYAPTGFMRIPRTAFEKLRGSQTTRGFKKPTHRFFERRYTEGTYDGGDVTFCRKWISTGGKVLIDSKLVLEHIGEYRWSGCFLDYLAKPENKELHTLKAHDPVPDFKPDTKIKGTLPDAIQALEDGQESIEDFIIIANSWGNKPWAATPLYCYAAWQNAMLLPEGSTILETGTGMSTIILAIAAKKQGLKLISLEHDEKWYQKTREWLDMYGLEADVVLTTLNEETQWYDYKLEGKFDFLLIDGPPRWGGANRLYPLKQGWNNNGAPILLDDSDANVVKKLKEIGGTWNQFNVGEREACLGKL